MKIVMSKIVNYFLRPYTDSAIAARVVSRQSPLGRFLLLTTFSLTAATISAQDDDIAKAQHTILGQNAAQAGVSVPVRNTHPDAQWFPKEGLGLFIHFGLATVHGGIDLSWGMMANKPWEDGEITPAAYWKLADRWNPVHFNAEAMVAKAKKAGFKYFVFTTKHHDGYTMWPSEYSTFGVKQKLGGRDLVKEFVDACHKHGVKTGLYYSPPDWLFDAPYKNWDYSGKTILDIHHQPMERLPEKPAGHDQARREMVANQMRELLTRYGRIDLFWLDGGSGEISNDEIRQLQPGIVINRRNGEPGDYGDSEGALPSRRFVGWFETCDPCWPSRWWTYSTSDRMDTGADVIEKLVILRAWGGNFLANVGPCPDGSLPEEALETWDEMEGWMKHSGESVYDVTGGDFPEKANQPTTLKKGIVYVHAFPNFHKTIVLKGMSSSPQQALLLRTGETVPFSYREGEIHINIPPEKRSRMVDTIKLVW